MDKPAEEDPRVYFAAERTFLAWIRTGLGLIAVGFAVSRFGLFMHEIGVRQMNTKIPFGTTSEWSGVVLVLLGVVVNIAATIRHVQITRELASGQWVPGKISSEAIALAIILAVAGILMAGYLFFVR